VAREDEIRLIAYNVWEQESCPQGRDCEHWSRAEVTWEEQQKPKTVATNTQTQPNQIIQKTKKNKAAKQKKS
jgi:hypothetical protein